MSSIGTFSIPNRIHSLEVILGVLTQGDVLSFRCSRTLHLVPVVDLHQVDDNDSIG